MMMALSCWRKTATCSRCPLAVVHVCGRISPSPPSLPVASGWPLRCACESFGAFVWAAAASRTTALTTCGAWRSRAWRGFRSGSPESAGLRCSRRAVTCGRPSAPSLSKEAQLRPWTYFDIEMLEENGARAATTLGLELISKGR